MLHETAFAKINLALHVRARRADGYHAIETIFAFADDGDRLTAEPADELTLHIKGPFAAGLSAGDDNLVLRAARALRERRGITAGARLRLDKRLPVASGIGGGSADAAATLRLLGRLWDVAVPDGLAGELGADVPACLLSRTSWAEGRGWPLVPLDAPQLTGMPLLLANPGVPLSTARIFGRWDGVDRGPLGRDNPLATAIAARNDLQPPAEAEAPAVGALVALLAAQPGVVLARMSGSGATCFALFDRAEDRDRAQAAVHAVRPRDWTMAARLV